MAQVAVALNGRTYRFVCGDGEEARILALADYVRGKMDSFGLAYGRPGDDRLLVMATLMLADELFEARGGTEVPQASAPAPQVRARKPGAA